MRLEFFYSKAIRIISTLLKIIAQNYNPAQAPACITGECGAFVIYTRLSRTDSAQ